jgi:DNA-binding MarR family transcriptional regulator
VAANTISTLVNQSVAAGWLLREVDPHDRRAVRLTLTEAAERHLAAWRDCAMEIVEEGIARLPARERTALSAGLSALEQLVDNLREPAGAPAGVGSGP